MLGTKEEKGRFGHSYLGKEDAKVPMIIYQNPLSKAETGSIDLSKVISHYQFGKLIAHTLGYNIINPNENGDFYINGVDISGSQGYITYHQKDAL